MTDGAVSRGRELDFKISVLEKVRHSQQNARLSEVCQEKDEAITALEQALLLKESQIEELTACHKREMEQQAEAHSRATQEVKALESKVEEFSSIMGELRLENHEMRSKLSADQGQVESLTSTVQRLSASVENSLREKSDLERLIESKEAQGSSQLFPEHLVQQAQSRIDALEGIVAQMELSCKEHLQALHEAQKQGESSNADLEELRKRAEQVDDLESQVSVASEKNRRLEESNRGLERELKLIKQKASEFELIVFQV